MKKALLALAAAGAAVFAQRKMQQSRSNKQLWHKAADQPTVAQDQAPTAN